MEQSPDSQLEPVRVACQAMATRFEIVLHGPNPVSLRAAGEEALYEIQRLESQFNLYSETSEISGINARAALAPIKVEPSLFQLLLWGRRLSQETDGAFDMTVAPLMKCWGFMKGTGRLPHPADVEAARALVGMDQLILDEQACTVQFKESGVMIDLGAIGKGYAIQTAAQVLSEDGVASALIHGGTSTVHAIGAPPGQNAWNVAIEFSDPQRASDPTHPENNEAIQPATKLTPLGSTRNQRTPNILAVVPLRDEALSVSAVWGKAFQSQDKWLGHVIDPRTGYPVSHAMLAATVLPSATETDALSTALLIGGREMQSVVSQARPNMRSLIAGKSLSSGKIWVHAVAMETVSPKAGYYES